jgi:hypothetical protein
LSLFVICNGNFLVAVWMQHNFDWLAVGFGLPNNHTVQNRGALSDSAQRSAICRYDYD